MAASDRPFGKLVEPSQGEADQIGRVELDGVRVAEELELERDEQFPLQPVDRGTGLPRPLEEAAGEVADSPAPRRRLKRVGPSGRQERELRGGGVHELVQPSGRRHRPAPLLEVGRQPAGQVGLTLVTYARVKTDGDDGRLVALLRVLSDTQAEDVLGL